MNQVGLHIHAGVSKTMAKAMSVGAKMVHAVHLDGWVNAIAKTTMIQITLDGVTRPEEQLWKGHFVECAPGVHLLQLAWHEGGLGVLMTSAHQQTVNVAVEAERVTQVLYFPKKVPLISEIHVIGTRPLGDLVPGANVTVVTESARYPARVLQTAGEYTLIESADGSQQWVPDVTVLATLAPQQR